jgi:rfaE bifunctional protein nucleotidyltransferase chain/domain
MASRKIVNLEQLLAMREAERSAGRAVVHCHGCFDIVHPGHIQHLEHARSLGDFLVVSVSADTHVGKGVNRPLIPEELRAGSVAALECVDAVYINRRPTAVELLKALRPDMYVKGKEYENNHDPRFHLERDAVEQGGGKVVFSSGQVVYSSTALINGMSRTEVFGDEKVRRFRETNDLTNQSLWRTLDRVRELKIVVVGDYILDRYHHCDVTGIAGESPMMGLRMLSREDFDGGAAVVALHAAGLGAKVSLVTSLADDDASRQTMMRLGGAGVNVQSAGQRRGLVCKSRFLVDQTKLFKVDDGQVQPPDSRRTQEAAEIILAAAAGADAVIFADFGYGAITSGLLEILMEPLRARVPILTADVSGRQTNLLNFRGVDLLCPTEREARETLNDFSSGLGAVAWNLMERTAANQAIITMGKQGLVTFAKPTETEVEEALWSVEQIPEPVGQRLYSQYLPSLAAAAIDPLGCGDALLAAASVILAAGGSLGAAAYVGSAAAAFEAGQIGNRPIMLDDLASIIGQAESAPVKERLAS